MTVYGIQMISTCNFVNVTVSEPSVINMASVSESSGLGLGLRTLFIWPENKNLIKTEKLKIKIFT